MKKYANKDIRYFVGGLFLVTIGIAAAVYSLSFPTEAAKNGEWQIPAWAGFSLISLVGVVLAFWDLVKEIITKVRSFFPGAPKQ